MSTIPPVPPERPDASTRLAEEQAKMRARAEEQGDASRVDPNLRPYKIEDLMVLHGLSRQTVIRIYEREPDVEIVPDLRPPGRSCAGRRCRTIRVPRHVYVRVRNRMRVR